MPIPPKPQTKKLSQNVSVKAELSIGAMTWIKLAFIYQDCSVMWAPVLGDSSPKAQLAVDVSKGTANLMAGLTVQASFASSNGLKKQTATIVTGKIVDGSGTHSISDTVIASFSEMP